MLYLCASIYLDNTTGLVLPISLAFFYLLLYRRKLQFSRCPQKMANMIIIITAEKLTSAFMLNRNGMIRDDFPNLKKLATKSKLYTDVHTRTIHTAEGLMQFCCGIATNSTFRDATISRPRHLAQVWLLYDFAAESTYIMTTLASAIRPKKHHCIKIFATSVGS